VLAVESLHAIWPFVGENVLCREIAPLDVVLERKGEPRTRYSVSKPKKQGD